MVSMAVRTAPDTSVKLLYIKFIRGLPRFMSLFSSIDICRIMFSTKTTPTSIIIPMAIAIPDSATMFASIFIFLIMINVSNTPIGNMLEITIEARRLKTITITTIIDISASKVSADSSVPIVSFIKPERS